MTHHERNLTSQMSNPTARFSETGVAKEGLILVIREAAKAFHSIPSSSLARVSDSPTFTPPTHQKGKLTRRS